MAKNGRRKPRVGWIVIAGIAVVLIIGAIAAAIILQQRGGGQALGTADSPSTAPVPASGAGAGAKGCMAGPGITATQLEQIRAAKDLTPTGAVEFLGAFKQFLAAGDPNYRTGVERVVQEMSSGDARALFSVASSSTGPALPHTHSTDLSQAYYRVVSADASSVVVDMMSIQIQDGERVSDGNGQYYFGGGRFTLAPSNTGWVITALGGKDLTIDDIRSTGYRFEGGC